MKKILFFFGALFLLSFCIQSVFAVPNGRFPGEGDGLTPPPIEKVDPALRNDDFRDQIQTILNYFLTFVGIIGVVAMIYYGFLWLASGGNEEQIETGKKGILYVALGILVILFSYVFVAFVINATTGADQNSENFMSKEEREINGRLDRMLERASINYGFSVEVAKEIQLQHENLFKGLPNSETLSVIGYHFFEGTIKSANDALAGSLFDTISIMSSLEEILDEKEKKEREKEARLARDAVKKSIVLMREKIKEIPRMYAEVNLNPKKGNVPLTVVFDGLQSSDPTNVTIPSANYSWSFLDYDGIEKDLGTGPDKVVTFNNQGNYVIRLDVSTGSGEKIMPGVATKSIRVEPPELTAGFLVDGEEVGSFLKVSLQDAQKGIRFDPKKTLIPSGTSVTEYLWNFNGEKISTNKNPDLVSNIFSQKGEYSVSLKVTGSTGTKSEKKIKITVEPSLAVVDASLNSPLVQEIVVFNGQRSSLDGGKVNRYFWKIYDPEGNLIKEIDDNPQFSYQFEDVGLYEVQLDIGNGISSSRQIEVKSKPPVAEFEISRQTPSNFAEITFDASGSFDPESFDVLYSWDFDGDGKLDIRNSKDPFARYVYQEKKLYKPRLVVVDTHGRSGETQKDIRISSLFYVDFSPEKFVFQKGDEMTFSIQTNDGVHFQWNFGDGIKADTESTLQKHIFTEEGKYSLQLVAFNDAGESVSVVKNVFVGDGVNPTPALSVLRNGIEMPFTENICGEGKHAVELYRYELIEFSAENSINSKGTRTGLQYKWNFGVGEEKSGSVITKNFIQISRQGSCSSVMLTITDTANEKSKSSDPVYIFVKNALPKMTGFVAFPEQIPCITPCQVNASVIGAIDPDGSILKYAWWAVPEGGTAKIDLHFSDNPGSNITLPAFGPGGKENRFLVYAEVTDNDGGKVSSEDIFSVPQIITTINGENPGHTVDFFVEYVSLSVGEKFLFTANIQNPLGDIIPKNEYRWDFDGDGVFDDTESGPTVSHSYSVPGEYDVQLRVQHKGNSDSQIRKVYVTENKKLPIADFSASLRGLLVSFDAGLSEWDQSNEENILSYFWDFDIATDSNLDGISDNDEDARGELVEYIFSKSGEYSVQLTVRSSDGSTDRVTKSISVERSSGNFSENGKIKRSIRLSGNLPMATLDMLVRIPQTQTDPAEIIAYGFSQDGSFLQGEAQFELLEGEGELSTKTLSFERGQASTFFIGERKQNSDYSVRIAVNTPQGTIVESISF